MLKIAKMEVDFKRKRHNMVCEAVQEREKEMGRTKGVVGQA